MRGLGVNENDEVGFHGARDFGAVMLGVKRPAWVAMVAQVSRQQMFLWLILFCQGRVWERKKKKVGNG